MYFPVIICEQNFLLPPATKLGQGYILTGIRDSVKQGGCLPQCMLGYPPPPSRHPQDQPPRNQAPPGSRPPRADTPQEQTPPRTRHPPSSRHPQHRACWEIQSTRGRYAPYWNAILLTIAEAATFQLTFSTE